MAYIESRKRPIAHSIGLGSTLMAGLLAPSVQAAEEAGVAELSKVSVEASQKPGYKADSLSTKFTAPVKDTPQTMQIINSGLLNDQQASTLTEALRNSPGVGTFYAGENGRSTTGDAVRMRGFDSSGSIYVDGVRDMGSVSRDTFNTEQIEVVKGAAGSDYGRTSPSGSINLMTKQAFLGRGIAGTVSAGTDDQKRATVDANTAVGEHSAVRLNVMAQDSGVPGRDEVKNKRWGIAPSVAFGLDTGTRVYLNYQHVEQRNVPDGLVPTVGISGYSSPDPDNHPEWDDAPEVDRSNFYGTHDDHDDVDMDMATVIVEHNFSGDTLLRNVTRWGQTDQEYALSAFMSRTFTTASGDPATLANLDEWQIGRLVNTKDQTNTIMTNQTALVTSVNTGSVKHTVSAGLEVTREKLETDGLSASAPDVDLYNPDHSDDITLTRTGASSEGTTTTTAVYLFDTAEIGEHWLVSGGLRYDTYSTEYEASSVCGGRGPDCGSNPAGTVLPSADEDTDGDLFSWKLGAMYRFDNGLNTYINYALAQQPPGGSNMQLSSSERSADNSDYDPQESRTTEIGAKWTTADDRLLLTAALYRTVVSNEVEQDESDGNYYQNGEKRVQGVELSAVGNITDNWNVSAGFTTMKATIEDGSADAQDGSDNLTYNPEKAFSSWTSYQLADVTLGGGVRYVDGLKRGRDGSTGTPEETDGYTVVDLMAGYQLNDALDLQLNVYNLFDKEYIASINKSGYRYTPGAPRSAMLALNWAF
ncbi:MAG: TonB-dependent siderophore receptor [Oceanospirillaceae bacterium]|nr:TonB-dependent siderophore receptor [Oceanospirillaceae bacterium]|tara:strand:+ start:4285 stop:6555 length:2271 start_codon:yes stop_codon:yes gene_type:complete